MSLLNKGKVKAPKFLQEHHFLFLERPFQDVADEILLWGWSSWWPKDHVLQYSSLGEHMNLEVGTPCVVMLAKKFKFMKAVFKGEVIQKKSQMVLQIEWRSGMMVGQEFILVEERSNGTRIDHRVRYKGSNILAQAVWTIFFRKAYDLAISAAVDAMKKHFEGAVK